LAVEAVIGKPVSALSFPVSRENTGKFWRRRPRTAISGLTFAMEIQWIAREFPGAQNREIPRLNRVMKSI